MRFQLSTRFLAAAFVAVVATALLLATASSPRSATGLSLVRISPRVVVTTLVGRACRCVCPRGFAYVPRHRTLRAPGRVHNSLLALLSGHPRLHAPGARSCLEPRALLSRR